VKIQRKCYWVPSLSRHVALRLSAKASRPWAPGIDAVVADLVTGEMV
jgi:ribosomal protein L28